MFACPPPGPILSFPPPPPGHSSSNRSGEWDLCQQYHYRYADKWVQNAGILVVQSANSIMHELKLLFRLVSARTSEWNWESGGSTLQSKRTSQPDSTTEPTSDRVREIRLGARMRR